MGLWIKKIKSINYSNNRGLLLTARALAFGLDYSLQSSLMFVILRTITVVSPDYDVLWKPTGVPAINFVLAVAFHIFISGIYVVISTQILAGTVGMWTWDLKMVATDTRDKPMIRQVAFRHLLSYVSVLAFGLGYLFALFHPQGATWHDLKSKIAVVPEGFGGSV